MSIAAVAAAIAAGRSGAAPVHDGHVCSGVVSGRGWGGRYRGGAARVAEQFFALLLRSTGGSEWVRWFCSVLLLLLCSSQREGRERRREGERGRERGLSCGAVLIYQGIKKKTIYKVGLYRGKQY